MGKWEYQSTSLGLVQLFGPEMKRYWDWAEKQEDGSFIRGLDLVLNKYGEQGWELLALIPTYWKGTSFEQQAESLRAVFKRRT